MNFTAKKRGKESCSSYNRNLDLSLLSMHEVCILILLNCNRNGSSDWINWKDNKESIEETEGGDWRWRQREQEVMNEVLKEKRGVTDRSHVHSVYHLFVPCLSSSSETPLLSLSSFLPLSFLFSSLTQSSLTSYWLLSFSFLVMRVSIFLKKRHSMHNSKVFCQSHS